MLEDGGDGDVGSAFAVAEFAVVAVGVALAGAEVAAFEYAVCYGVFEVEV